MEDGSSVDTVGPEKINHEKMTDQIGIPDLLTPVKKFYEDFYLFRIKENYEYINKINK